MNEQLFKEIREFIADEMGIDPKRITTESRMEQDLMITGTDAMEFLIAYAKKFKVDVSKFMVADYFEGEDVGMRMKWLMPGRRPSKKILTVGHLEKASIAGKLDESVING